VRKALIALAKAKDAVETADRRVKRVAADEEASKAAVAAKAQAEAKAGEAEAALSAAQRVKAEMDRDAALGPAPAILEARSPSTLCRRRHETSGWPAGLMPSGTTDGFRQSLALLRGPWSA
jgi:hypothetical protein